MTTMGEQELHLSFIGITISVILTALFALTLFLILKRIPGQNQKFPPWVVWLFLIPIAGLVIQWIVLLSIPSVLKKTFSNNQDAIQSASTLFKFALASMVFTIFSFLPIKPYSEYFGIAGIVFVLIYWGWIIRFKMIYIR